MKTSLPIAKMPAPGVPMKTSLPIAKIVRLLSKVVRLSRDGLTAAERQEIAGDLLELAAIIIEGRA
jgi:hypothetical protein